MDAKMIDALSAIHAAVKDIEEGLSEREHLAALARLAKERLEYVLSLFADEPPEAPLDSDEVEVETTSADVLEDSDAGKRFF